MHLSSFKNKVYILGDEDISLRVLEPQHVDNNYVRWMNDYEIVKHTEQKYRTHSINGVKGFVFEKYKSDLDLLFGIYYKSAHIGNIKLGPIDFNHLVSDISYFIGDKTMWGQGITSQVIDAVVGIAFDEIGLEKVTAGAYENNLGSIRVLEKNGFVREGVKKSQVLFEGKRIDAIIYGKIKEET